MVENTAPDPALQSLGSLLQLEREARHAESVNDLSYLIVNETARLVPYRAAFLWKINKSGMIELIAASSVSEVDKKSPLVAWLGKVISEIDANNALRETRLYEAQDFRDELQDDWYRYLTRYLYNQPLLSPSGELIGGLLLSRDEAPRESENVLLDRLSDAYGHSFKALDSGFHFREQFAIWWQKHRKKFIVAMVILFLFPVRQSVLAPAQVEAANPLIVAAPLTGVVEKMHVDPNQPVSEGDLLFSLDQTDIRNQAAVAGKAVEVARADYLKNSQMAFDCPSCKAKLPTLKAVLDQKVEELSYHQSLLERSEIRAEKEGLAVYTDRNQWLGKPVKQGEKVLFLADPEDTRLAMELPIDDAIAMETGTEVKLYLNINPFVSYDARLSQTSYQAEVTEDGVLAYNLYANFTDEFPRIGLRGTAKIYGQWTVFGYYIFRKPFAWVRQKLGW